MKKFLVFGLIAAGAAVAAAAIFKSKSKGYICDDETDDYDDCCCDCDDDCCGDICEIPAEKAEESSIPGDSDKASDSKTSDPASDELGI